MCLRFFTALACLFAFSAHAGLHLASDRVLVLDRDTGATLYAKDAAESAPIASVTKLMTAIVLLDENPDLREQVTITEEDVDRLKYSSSRLPVGTKLSKAEMLHLTLMSSENRAAHALARTSRKGVAGFVAAMNAKAQALGMSGAQFADPTGLSPSNRASAVDLAKLVDAASGYAPIRRFTQDDGERVRIGQRQLNYVNSNPVVRSGWDVLLSKTGFIREAGRVVVMGFKTAGRNVSVVLMGADSGAARTRDLELVRDWVGSLSGAKATKVTKKARAVAKHARRSVRARR